MLEHKSTQGIVPKISSNRVFGGIFALFFSIVACQPLVSGGDVRAWALLVAGAFAGVAAIFPDVLAPLNRMWMKLGNWMHGIVSPIALGVVFFLAIFPIGLLMRLLGKDPLRLCFDPDAESYWIKRDPPGPDRDSLNNQF